MQLCSFGEEWHPAVRQQGFIVNREINPVHMESCSAYQLSMRYFIRHHNQHEQHESMGGCLLKIMGRTNNHKLQ